MGALIKIEILVDFYGYPDGAGEVFYQVGTVTTVPEEFSTNVCGKGLARVVDETEKVTDATQ
ncbi:MAG: hypothetical protein HXX10_07680 [Rhodoplanes sp.]|uniref:hypothetical protein n=1 Tax=Rhodoplanes sp. TaxID=1968906 RepID=UPI0017AF27FD|nr:hypothetical protein [Rhodoplanes sp.]NVO13901.1 hypothetical protein [Rhodoplanes sp.]